jgi:hypothetical protein
MNKRYGYNVNKRENEENVFNTFICKKILTDGLIIDYMYNTYKIKIEIDYSIYLTIGKVYYSDRCLIDGKGFNMISIRDNLGFGRYVPQELFITIQEQRDINLEILLG